MDISPLSDVYFLYFSFPTLYSWHFQEPSSTFYFFLQFSWLLRSDIFPVHLSFSWHLLTRSQFGHGLHTGTASYALRLPMAFCCTLKVQAVNTCGAKLWPVEGGNHWINSSFPHRRRGLELQRFSQTLQGDPLISCLWDQIVFSLSFSFFLEEKYLSL